MGPICPECQAGKHTNCNGIGNVNNELMPIACRCENGEHPNRSHFFLEHPPMIMDVDEKIPELFPDVDSTDTTARREEYDQLIMSRHAEGEPENDPGFSVDAFPDLDEDEDWMAQYRMRPDAEVIQDLFDVQVQNPNGEWVPAVPMPIFLQPFWLKRVQCHCKKKFWSKQRYQEHYAYAHILGMED